MDATDGRSAAGHGGSVATRYETPRESNSGGAFPNGSGGAATLTPAGTTIATTVLNPAQGGATVATAATGGISSSGGSPASTGGGTASIDPFTGCAGSEWHAELTPTYIVFVYDKSGSMGEDSTGAGKITRWGTLNQGMLDFFTQAAARSAAIGTRASMTFFPAAGDITQTCEHDYRIPDVPMTALESAQPLVAALQSATPAGGTPTLPAVVGGITYAKQLLATNSRANAVVVLITDGEPGVYSNGQIVSNCAPAGSVLTNTVADIASVVSAAYESVPSIPTYVIGIGEATTSMDLIAQAGGTKRMTLLSEGDPSTTRSELSTALSAIPLGLFNCSIPVPTVNFVPDLLNVYFRHSNGTLELVRKSQNCTLPGWYYEPVRNPTNVMLCPAMCDAVQQDLDGQLTYQQGCGGIVL